jgi:lysine-specific demethylase PHF8
VYEIERNTDIGDKFLYPKFETINWLAARYLLQQISEFNARQECAPQYLVQGIKALVPVLKLWNQERSVSAPAILTFIVIFNI